MDFYVSHVIDTPILASDVDEDEVEVMCSKSDCYIGNSSWDDKGSDSGIEVDFEGFEEGELDDNTNFNKEEDEFNGERGELSESENEQCTNVDEEL